MPTKTELPKELADERTISVKEAAKITGLSPDTLKRHYPKLIRQLSPRRRGMKLRDVLAIGAA